MSDNNTDNSYIAKNREEARDAFSRSLRPSGAMETFRIRMADNCDDHVAAFTAARCTDDPEGRIVALADSWGIRLTRCDAEHMVAAYRTAVDEDQIMADYNPEVGLPDENGNPGKGGLTQCS